MDFAVQFHVGLPHEGHGPLFHSAITSPRLRHSRSSIEPTGDTCSATSADLRVPRTIATTRSSMEVCDERVPRRSLRCRSYSSPVRRTVTIDGFARRWASNRQPSLHAPPSSRLELSESPSRGAYGKEAAKPGGLSCITVAGKDGARFTRSKRFPHNALTEPNRGTRVTHNSSFIRCTAPPGQPVAPRSSRAP